MNLLKWIKNILKHLTEEPSAPIVIEATPKYIIMATKIEPVIQARNWAIERIQSTENYDIAVAITEEFLEWLDPEDEEELEYFSLETKEEYGDQEIDVK
jgi:hypothetical protein